MLFSNTPEFIGRYQVVKELKSGGMGTVFLARDPRIGKHMGGRFIAIKVLQEFDDVELRARFEREADIAGTLDHRNIVQIYDRDEFDGRPFIVMEFVDGRTLSELIETGTVPLVRKLQWMEELCDGLACAHNAGVVHRDIKPANIMIRALDGVLKILDFGIARANTIKVNMTRGILGTLNYMAPEQWDSTGTVDSRADAFAAGAVFYELLSGEKAFPGNDVPSIYRQIATHPPEPLEKRHPNLDPDLIAIVNRCLEKRPADRYADMVAVRADLGVIRQRLAARDAAVTLVRPARTFVNDAQRALEQGDFTLALKAVEQALRMEPDNTAARDLEQRARTAIQVENWLQAARGEFERGALTAASMLVEQILTINESHPDALSIRLAIETVRRELDRARQIDAASERARERLAAGALDEARAALAELLQLDPESAVAAPLRQRLESAIEERRIAEENARARQAVAEARRQFAAGQQADAMAMLERHQPAHAAVTAALAELRAEYQEIERRRQEEERRRQQEEQRRQEEQRQIAAANERARQTVAEARRLIGEGKHPAALQLLEAHQPPHADVTAAREALRDTIAELERQHIEAERRKQEQLDAQRRKEEEEARQRAAAERQKQEQARIEAQRKKEEEEQEARRLAAEREKQEQARIEAQRKKEKEEQEARRLAAERQKQEQARIEAQRKKEKEEQEAKRLADERKKQEEAREAERRKAEEQRRLEAQKQAAERARRDEEKTRQAAAAAASQATVDGDRLEPTVRLKTLVEPELVKTIQQPTSGVIERSGRPNAVDWRILAAAAVIVMALATFGVMKWRSGSSDVATGGSSAPANDSAQATTPAASPPAAPPASSTPAPPPVVTAPPPPEPSAPASAAGAPPAKAEPGGSAAINSQVAALRATAQQEWARDARDQAMTSIMAALKLKPGDADTSRLATGFVRQMAERSSNAASAARSAGAPDTAGSPFDTARRRVQDAAALERAGKPDQSVRAYGDALDLFAKAIATAKATSPAGATPPAPTTAAPAGTATASTNAAAGTSAAGAAAPTPTPPPVLRTAAPPPVVETPPPAPAPAPTPVVPAPPPPVSASVTNAARAAAEESAVRQVLQRYRNGYESLSASAVQAVYPGINATALADVFKLYSSLKQDLEIDRVEVEGQTAIVTGSVTTAPVVKTGRAAPKKSKAVFRLRKTGDAWLIQDVSLK